jgi:RHS repeat-associated protein
MCKPNVLCRWRGVQNASHLERRALDVVERESALARSCLRLADFLHRRVRLSGRTVGKGDCVGREKVVDTKLDREAGIDLEVLLSIDVTLRGRRRRWQRFRVAERPGLTNTHGALVSFARYDAFGNLALGTSSASAFGYAGQYTDTGPDPSGFDNMRARWYDPETGGFTSRDPAFAATDEAYAYAGGDPVNRSDPSGLGCPWWDAWCQDINLAHRIADDVAGAAVNDVVSPAINAAVGVIEHFCAPSNPPYGETIYGNGGCVVFQTDPVTGTTSWGVTVYPWAVSPLGKVYLIVTINGHYWQGAGSSWGKESYPTVHALITAQFAPPGTLITIEAYYETLVSSFHTPPGGANLVVPSFASTAAQTSSADC